MGKPSERDQPAAIGGRWYLIDEVDLAPLLADHSAIRGMCSKVEALADRLADLPTLEERCEVADLIQSRIHDHVVVTSNFMKGALAGTRSRLGGGILTRVLVDQIADGIHAEDVVEALRRKDLAPAQVDTLAYMLRCLFDGCRRALVFEELGLLFLGRHRLARDARLALKELLEREFEGLRV